mmetsp:Transcript_51239/g.61729  ORF Transcript_51239/g.61729 Transcript_51239/m.61729 type:complete len:167 (+) Transcript_51239:246-746(+)
MNSFVVLSQSQISQSSTFRGINSFLAATAGRYLPTMKFSSYIVILALLQFEEVTKNVAAGKTCVTWEQYDSSKCSGNPLRSRTETVGDSLEAGCTKTGSASSYSKYCDDDGYHYASFNSADCSTQAISGYNYDDEGCYTFRKSVKWYCALDGPCGRANWIDLFLND